MTEDEEIEFFKSEDFIRKFRERVEEETWGQGLTMVYLKDGKIVRHFSDGRIEVIKELEDKLIKVEQKQFKI